MLRNRPSKSCKLGRERYDVKACFDELKRQTDLDFFFSNRELDMNSKVTIQVQKNGFNGSVVATSWSGISIRAS